MYDKYSRYDIQRLKAELIVRDKRVKKLEEQMRVAREYIRTDLSNPNEAVAIEAEDTLDELDQIGRKR